MSAYEPKPDVPEDVRAAAAYLGRKGGRIGGKAKGIRKQRSKEHYKGMAAIRWAKKREADARAQAETEGKPEEGGDGK